MKVEQYSASRAKSAIKDQGDSVQIDEGNILTEKARREDSGILQKDTAATFERN